MKENKIYKIGDKIEEKELLKVSKGIVVKALKVIESSGNSYATRIVEGKDKDMLEDLIQTVCIKLIESNYIITKECYKIVNNYLYNYKVDKINNVEIVINEDTGYSNVDTQSYISYTKSQVDIYNERQDYYKKMSLNELKLTSKQLEILNIYSSLGSMQKTAEILNISKSTVQTIIERIRIKANKMVYDIEY